MISSARTIAEWSQRAPPWAVQALNNSCAVALGRLTVLLNIGKCLTFRFLLHRGRFHDSPGTDVSAFLVWGSRCQALILNNSIFSSFPCYPFVWPPAEPILSSRPAASWARRAQGRSRMAVAKSFIYAQPFPGHSLMDPEHGGRLGHVGINGAVIR